MRDVFFPPSPISAVKAGATMPPSEMETLKVKKLIVFAFLAFASLCSASLASAQARQLQGKIPFDFNAGPAQMSAGEYRIVYDLTGFVTLRNLTNGQTATTFVGADSGINDGTCKLIFARYGDQHFLNRNAPLRT